MLNFVLALNITTWHWQARKQSVTTDVLIHSQYHVLPDSILTVQIAKYKDNECPFLFIECVYLLLNLMFIHLSISFFFTPVVFSPLLVVVLSRAVSPTASYISSVPELPFFKNCVSLCTSSSKRLETRLQERSNRNSVLFLQGREVSGKSIMSAINNPLNVREI